MSLGWASVAGGEIIGGTSFTKIFPPLNVGSDNQQDPKLMGFDELQGVVLTSALWTDSPAGSIPAGTRVNSHYILYDPVSNSSITGTIVFDADILGIMTATTTLAASDSQLSWPGTNYLSPSLRGLEPGDDFATISDSRTVSVALSAASPGDYIRVVTTPEPATLWLLVIGGAAVLKRRSKA